MLDFFCTRLSLSCDLALSGDLMQLKYAIYTNGAVRETLVGGVVVMMHTKAVSTLPSLGSVQRNVQEIIFTFLWS